MPFKRGAVNREIRMVCAALVIGAAVALTAAARTYVYSETTQAEIAKNVLRFHVVANSDSEDDQVLKLCVRDAVLETFADELNASNTVDETRAFIAERLDEIRERAETEVRARGYDYAVSADIETVFFPTKAYGDFVFPPGEYEALKIVIGEGMGHNWWCVMFPPLCYVDAAYGEISDGGKQRLMNALTEEEYNLLTYPSGNGSFTIKFKIVEWWQNRKAGKK